MATETPSHCNTVKAAACQGVAGKLGDPLLKLRPNGSELESQAPLCSPRLALAAAVETPEATLSPLEPPEPLAKLAKLAAGPLRPASVRARTLSS